MAQIGLQELLRTLYKNYNILREREAKYAATPPLDLLNQLDDYQKAIAKTEQALAQNIPLDELEIQFSGLNLQLSAVVFIPSEPPRQPFTGENPYRGLLKFTETDARFFFGRTEAVQNLLQRVQRLLEAKTGAENPNLMAVLGASGSGKSSLVRAGLVPALSAGRIQPTPNGFQIVSPDEIRGGQGSGVSGYGSEAWSIKVIVPGPRPLDALAEVFVGEVGRGLAAIRAELDGGEKALHYLMVESLVAKPKAAVFVLVVDQFEELFTLTEQEAERQAFLDLLLYACQTRRNRSCVILTMRADFYSKVAVYKPLADVITLNQMLVSPMTEKELREAILLPAEAVGLELEKDLVEALIHDTVEAPGALPLLQHALLELFQRRDGNLLTMKAYREIGGIKGALAHRADGIVASLTPEQQQMARHIFLRLTALGEGVSDTRRRIAQTELYPAGVDSTQVDAVLRALTGEQSRLVVADKQTVEVTHEALIQQWGTLRAWLEENRESLRIHRRLEETAKEWAANKRDPSYLYRDARLAQTEEWADAHKTEMTPLEQEFLTASIDERDRAAREEETRRQRELEQMQKLAEEQRQRVEEQERAAVKLRKRNIGLAIFGIVAVLLAIAAGVFGIRSGQNEKLAETQTQFATSRELAAAAITNLPIDPERSILLARQALAITYTVQAENALRQALQTLRVELRLSDHAIPLRGIALSPDGTRLAAGGQDKTVKVWNLSKPHPEDTLQVLVGHNDRVESVVFSPDGTRLATASRDKTVKIWDIVSGKALLTLAGHTGWILSVKFNPDGTRLATASVDGRAKVWDVLSGKILLTLTAHSGAVIGVAFSPDGQQLVTTGQDGSVKVWNSLSGQELQTLFGHTDQVSDAAFSPDGTRLATASQDKTIKIWDTLNLETGKPLQTLFGHTNTIIDVDFSPNGRCLATASTDKTAKVWDATSGETLLTLAGHSDWVYGVTFDLKRDTPAVVPAPCGTSRLITTSLDGTVRIWNIGASREWLTLSGHTDAVQSVAFSPDSRLLATASSDTTAKVWEIASGQTLLNLMGHTGTVNRIVFSMDGKYLATVSDDTTAMVWTADSGQLKQTFMGHTDIAWGVAFSPDGLRLATAGQDKTVKLWDIHLGRVLQTWSDSSFLYSVNFSPDGTRLATASEDGNARIWEIASGKILATFYHPPRVYDIAFSPDGLRLATAGSDITAKLWEIASGRELNTFSGHRDRIFSLEFSSDGLRLATASADADVIIWEVASGQALHRLISPTREINDLAFSPDGKYLATAGADGTVRLYALNIEDLMTLGQTRLTRSWTIEECQQFLHQAECPGTP